MAATNNSVAELNREWFDSVAGSIYKEQWIRDLVQQISSFVGNHIEWIGQPAAKERGLKVLDYACGPGTVSTILAPFASILRGIDVSGEMVKHYDNTARLLGLSPEQMRAVRGDLLTGEDNLQINGPEFTGFNVAVISMALHHVADPAAMVRKLAERLAPGGSLVIVDWVAEGATLPMPSEHPAAHTVTRHGFSEAQIKSMLAEAGLLDYEYLPSPERSKVPSWGEPQLFLARAKRPTQ